MKNVYVVINVWVDYSCIVSVCDDLKTAAEIVYKMEKEEGFEINESFEEFYEKKMWDIDTIMEYTMNVYYKA